MQQPFQLLDGNDLLVLGQRNNAAPTDEVLLSVAHKTTGGGRSVLLTRPEAAAVHQWLGQWLGEGWDKVPRTCQAEHKPDRLHVWVCDQEPGHRNPHDGRAAGWKTGEQPHRETWPLTAAERDQAVLMDLAVAAALGAAHAAGYEAITLKSARAMVSAALLKLAPHLATPGQVT